MKLSKIQKIMIILITIVTILLITISEVQAGGYSNNITQWSFNTPTIPPLVSQLIGVLVAFLQNLSIMVTVAVITILGLKYMIGSVEEKAEYKKDYIDIIVGVILINGVFIILNTMFRLSEGLL